MFRSRDNDDIGVDQRDEREKERDRPRHRRNISRGQVRYVWWMTLRYCPVTAVMSLIRNVLLSWDIFGAVVRSISNETITSAEYRW